MATIVIDYTNTPQKNAAIDAAYAAGGGADTAANAQAAAAAGNNAMAAAGPTITITGGDPTAGGAQAFPVSGTAAGNNGPVTGAGSIVTTGDGTNTNTSITIPQATTANQIKSPTPTKPIPNPLHQFASYTYNWSLWWVDFQEFNDLMGKNSVNSAQGWAFGPKSFVVAEDSGKYPTRRLPGTLGLNYHIQSVTFKNTVAPNSQSQASNMTTGSMVILEPTGCTFLDQLIAASFNGTEFVNYTQQPFILQLEFTGYDESGNPIANSTSNVYKKRFPIRITNIAISVTTKGTEYKIKFTKDSHEGLTKEYGNVPVDISIEGAKTVGEFFKQLEDKMNAFFATQKTKRLVEFADTFKFNVDPTIASSPIVNKLTSSVGDTDPKAKKDQLNFDGKSVTIDKRTSINTVITRVMAHSKFLQDQQKNTGQTTAFNAFKVTVKSLSVGDGTVKTNNDHYRNQPPKQFIFNILQFTTFKSDHPGLPQMVDSRPYTVKDYQYLYTGKNVDITDLKIDFNNSWYQTVSGYTFQYPSTVVSPSTPVFKVLDLFPSINITPSFLSTLIPSMRSVATSTPMRIKPVTSNPNDTQGYGTIKSPDAQKMVETLRNGVYTASSGTMLNVKLTILGDPTLLKQDDWYYIPSANPAAGEEKDDYDKRIAQSEYVAKYGHLRTDTEELVVRLTFNGVTDIDTDITNQGGVYPPIGSVPSLFTGQYQITGVENKFEKGLFTQILTLKRYFSDDYTAAYRQSQTSSRDTSTIVQQVTAFEDALPKDTTAGPAPPNTSTVAGGTSVPAGNPDYQGAPVAQSASTTVAGDVPNRTVFQIAADAAVKLPEILTNSARVIGAALPTGPQVTAYVDNPTPSAGNFNGPSPLDPIIAAGKAILAPIANTIFTPSADRINPQTDMKLPPMVNPIRK
jgi:hypothetical protein